MVDFYGNQFSGVQILARRIGFSGAAGRVRSDRTADDFLHHGIGAGVFPDAREFPKHVRAGYLASAYAVAVSVFGGTSQLVVAWLIKATGNTMAPAWYMIGCVIVSLIAVSMLEETGGRDLDAG
ncbi:hypothetical protein [Paraburkholderia fungorum]|uniref:hypothetical protein n=1 Tax=Paraburkholderia fungorum TaxID=134537 RepID=UPI0020A75EFD|nr:hypothetical protein [Paraburkholderia fungorum]